MNALLAALVSGNLAAVTNLLKTNPLPKEWFTEDGSGKNALMVALDHEQTGIALALLKHPSFPAESLSQIDNQNRSALTLAIEMAHSDDEEGLALINEIINHPLFPSDTFKYANKLSHMTCLLLAVSYGNAAVIRTLVQHKNFPPVCFIQMAKDDQNALMMATKHSRPVMAALLSNPNIPKESFTNVNVAGKNAVRMAVEQDNAGIVTDLTLHPNIPIACFTAIGTDGNNVLMLAGERGNKDVVDALLTAPTMPISTLEAKRSQDGATFFSLLQASFGLSDEAKNALLQRPLITVPAELRQYAGYKYPGYFHHHIPFVEKLLKKSDLTLAMIRKEISDYDAGRKDGDKIFSKGALANIQRSIPEPITEFAVIAGDVDNSTADPITDFTKIGGDDDDGALTKKR